MPVDNILMDLHHRWNPLSNCAVGIPAGEPGASSSN
jgi:hypothetical protein